MARNRNLVAVGTAWSKSDPDTRYTLFRDRQTGDLSCQCKAWIFAPSCGVCGRQLLKGTDSEGHRTFRCTVHGLVGAGVATRSCKHLIEYAKPVAAPFDTTVLHALANAGVAKAQPKPVVHADDVTPLGLVRAAAQRAGVLDKMNEWHWKALAKQLADLLVPAAADVLEQATFDYGGLRTIILDD